MTVKQIHRGWLHCFFLQNRTWETIPNMKQQFVITYQYTILKEIYKLVFVSMELLMLVHLPPKIHMTEVLIYYHSSLVFLLIQMPLSQRWHNPGKRITWEMYLAQPHANFISRMWTVNVTETLSDKGRAILVCLENSRRQRLPDFQTMGTWMW